MEAAFQRLTLNEGVGDQDACSYCGIPDAKCLIKCKECQKWFCNWSGKTFMSHIVVHLMQSGHREVTLNKQGRLKGMSFKCTVCDCKNVFQLGFVDDKISRKTDWFCRLPCSLMAKKHIEDTSLFDVVDLWKPLISDHSFSFMVVNEPSKDVIMNAKPLSFKNILKLEDLWEVDETASFSDVIKSPSPTEFERVSLRYESAQRYLSVFAPLVKMEADYDKNKRNLLNDAKSEVRWEMKAGRVLAYINLSSIGEDVHLMHGNRISMKHAGKTNGHKNPWNGTGCVFKVPKNFDGVVGICLERGSTPPVNYTTGFTITSLWNPTTYLRMQRALQTFSSDDTSVSIYVFRRLLGHDVEDVRFKCRLPTNYSAPNLPTLNTSQLYAVKHALQQPVSLIQGPPGTGKTVTSASLVYHLFNQNKSQMLVCAPSNTAVDHLAEKIHMTGLNVVRLCCKSREELESTLTDISLHGLVRNSFGQPQLKKLQKIKDETGKLSPDDDEKYKILLHNCEQRHLKAAGVICCTCSSAGDPRLNGYQFHTVLIDESTQATEPECLIPIVKGIKQVILVGDHCQLGPTVLCPKAAAAGLGTSLFQRFLVLGTQPFLLNQQYRMHPELSKFPSQLFYEGALKDGVSENERQCNTGFPWPTDKPTFFYATPGVEEISATGHSFLNRTETKLVEQIVAKFLSLGVKAKQIGIITPYDGQKNYILQYMHNCGSLNYSLYQDLEVSSVDGFQGREKDFIILSCVRSNKCKTVGFLNDPRRLNVAITRARYGLIILGDAKVLAKHSLWNHLLTYYQEQNVLMEGSLDNLQHCNLQFNKPEKLVNKLNPENHFMDFAVFESSSAIIPGNFAEAKCGINLAWFATMPQ